MNVRATGGSANGGSDRRPLVAAVVIGRNEGQWLERSLRSVLESLEPYAPCDVVYVDSASTDRSVEIARRFPIRIAVLRSDIERTPAMGRVVGERMTVSRHILFVDGDSEIEPAWLRAAVDLLEQDAKVAGVGGKLREIYYRDGRVVGENPDCFYTPDAVVEVDQLGGNALYRRDALERAGSFHPYVASYEEAELAERLRRSGYSVVRLPLHVATHHTGVPGSVPELWRRFRQRLIVGYGQVLRLGLRNGTFFAHARSMNRYLLFDAFLLAGLLAAVVSIAAADMRYIGAWLATAAALLAAFIVRSRSIRKPLRQVLDWSIWAVPMVVGFFRAIPPAESFDVRHVVAEVFDGRRAAGAATRPVEAEPVRG